MSSLKDFVAYLMDNKEWIFSGVGVLVMSGILVFLRNLIQHKRTNTNMEKDKPPSKRSKSSDTTQAVPEHWQGIIPENSKYRIHTEMRDAIPLGVQSFSFEYGPRGHAKPLDLLGITLVEAEIQFTCRIVNPHKAIFASNEYALSILPPRFLVKARGILEKHSLTKLRSDRDEVSEKIIQKMSPEFDELGVRLETVTIGALQRLNTV